MLSAGNFDIILMDMHMREMDGLEATRAIRTMPAPASLVPIVRLTAEGAESDIQICKEAGMNDAMVKPFRVDRLENLCRELAAGGMR